MKFRQRLRRLEQMLRLKEPPPPMRLFLSEPGRSGYELRAELNAPGIRVSEEKMNRLCNERPQNAPIPMILHLRNLRPETDPKPATVEPSWGS